MPMSPEGLRDWLLAGDRASTDARLERLSILVDEYGTPSSQVFFGGPLCQRFFEEARWCFVNGQYIACVLLCQSFFEQSLQSMLAASAPNTGIDNQWLEKAGFQQLVKKARDTGLLNDVQATDLHWLRRTRKQYVHPKPVWHDANIGRRVLEEGKEPETICAEDARKAIQVMLRLNQEKPFQRG